MRKETALLLSGGIDSLYVAKTLRETGWTLHSLFIDFNEPHSQQSRIVAAKIADKYCWSHEEWELKGCRPITMDADSGMMPEGWPWTPFFGAVVLGIGVTFTRVKGLYKLAGGFKPDFFEDNLKEGFQTFLKTSKLQNRLRTNIELVFPLFDMKTHWLKTELKELKDEPLLHETVTCHFWPPCGKCGPCKARREYGIGEGRVNAAT